MTDHLMSLEDGCYILNPSGPFGEAVRFASAEYDILKFTQIRLPDGNGNIVYIITDTFENSFKVLSSGNFIIPPLYRRLYYPSISQGSFFGIRYRLNLNKIRDERNAMIRNNTKLFPYVTRKIAIGDKSNIIFVASDIINMLLPIVKRFPIKRIATGYFKEFTKILKDFTPEYTGKKDLHSGHRIMLIDAENLGFKPNASIQENKTNPLFILYIAYFRTKDLTQMGVDQDILITAKNMFIKFNPNRLTPAKFNKFRTALFKIMKINLDEYTSKLSKEDLEELDIDQTDIEISNTVNTTVDSMTKYNSPGVKAVAINAVEDKVKSNIVNKTTIAQTIQDTATRAEQRKHENLFSRVVGTKYDPLTVTTDIPVPNVMSTTTTKSKVPNSNSTTTTATANTTTRKSVPTDSEIVTTMSSDDDIKNQVIAQIQTTVAPSTDPAVTTVNPLEQKLREKQKQIVVKDSTIGEILSRESSNVPIIAEDKGRTLTTSNENVKTIVFSNFDKTYLDNLFYRDIIAVFDCLKDKPNPLYITDIKIEDSSTVDDLKETWKVKLTNEVGKTYTVTVDIPKFYQHRFMRLGGNKWLILKQNFYNPLVKDTENEVVITTNQKVFVTRRDTKSLSQVERIISFARALSKNDADKTFITGNSSKINLNNQYHSSLEYDELSKRLFKFQTSTCVIYFNRKDIESNVLPTFTGKINDDEFLIGFEKKEPLLINNSLHGASSGRDRQGRTIADIIKSNLNPDQLKLFNSTSVTKQPMFASATLAGSTFPVGIVLVVWVGITKMLDRMGIRWSLINGRVPPSNSTSGYLKFSDCVLEYENEIFAQLIINGLLKLKPDQFKFEDLNSEKGYYEYLHVVTGKYTFKSELIHFYNFMMDPITIEICQDLLLPTEADLLLIQAVRLLTTNPHNSKASDKSYRVRSIEIIPAILYKEMQRQYVKYVNSAYRREPTLPQRVVIDALVNVKTVEEYSTLNPAIEVGRVYTISAKGYGGSNTDDSYDEEKRSYDETSLGKLSMSSSPDANIGISRELALEPTIMNARGHRKPVDADELEDINLFSPVELLTPGTVGKDDPIRVAIAGKQSRHLVPVKDASPSLISNGYDEAIQFHLSNDFVVNAAEDGEVVDVNEETGFITVKYKSGEHQAFITKPEIVKNSGSGFYISNTLTATVKLGDKFKKDDVLAYHDKYFKYSKLNGLRYAIGPLVKIAFMSTYNTYEDAGFCTKKLADQLRTSIVYKEDTPLMKTTNIISMANIGDIVNVGDSLLQFDVTFDDSEIVKLVDRLPSDSSRERILEDLRTDFKSHHAGKIVDIQVFSLYAPEELTPTLGKVVQQYFDRGNKKNEYLSKYDPNGSTIKAGYLLTDSKSVTVDRYNRIRGYRNKDVVIEFYIEHEDVAGVGDKIAMYSANKNIISQIIPEGYEPYSEHDPSEEISTIVSPGTIARRMTQSTLTIAMGAKCLKELKKKIKSEIKFK